MQAPTNIHEDEELISALAASGCFSLSIGFQTPHNANNRDALILQNDVNNYKKLVDLLHKYKVLVDGTFIFGFDGDSRDTFAVTEDLIRYLELDTYTFYFLTPYPGTKYFDRFSNEGRILSEDWSRFDWDHVVMRPKTMTGTEMQMGVEDLYRRLDKTYFSKNALKNVRLYANKVSLKELLYYLLSIGRNYRASPISRL